MTVPFTNPSLQNTQQAVEKALKATLVEQRTSFPRTHSIRELMMAVKPLGISILLEEDELDLLDSIYLPSKYPLGSALPDFSPGEDICERCLTIAERVLESVSDSLRVDNRNLDEENKEASAQSGA